MGRLLGMGSGRKRRLYAMASYDRLPSFRDDSRTQRHAEGLELGSDRHGFRVDPIRHLHHAQRSYLVGPFVHPIGAGTVFPDFPDSGRRPLYWIAPVAGPPIAHASRVRVVSLA